MFTFLKELFRGMDEGMALYHLAARYQHNPDAMRMALASKLEQTTAAAPEPAPVIELHEERELAAA